jgi:hypothetical protein
MGNLVIQSDPITNDIFLTSNQLTMATGVQAISDVAKAKLEAQLREMVLQWDQGMPTFDTVFQGNNLQQYVAVGIERLSQISGVTQVVSFNANFVSGQMVYTAVIQTVYSPQLLTITNEGVQ